MSESQSAVSARPAASKGMTLLELLAVISAIALLIALVMPAMHAIHEEGSVATCLNNLHQIGLAASYYNEENTSIAKGCRPTLPWYLDYTRVPTSCSIGCYGEYIYGGFKASVQDPYCHNLDAYCVANEYRPFNKYIAPGITGSAVIKQYICPSDKSCATPLFGQGTPPVIEHRYSSWEVNGSSYAINWYWPNYFEQSGPATPHEIIGSLSCMSMFGTAMLSKKVGGAAAEFVVFMEGMMNAYMDGARPQDWPTSSPLQTPGLGWHGRLSMYCMAMWDGHSEYRYVDTRYTDGPGYDLWPERDTQWPTDCPGYKKQGLRER